MRPNGGRNENKEEIKMSDSKLFYFGIVKTINNKINHDYEITDSIPVDEYDGEIADYKNWLLSEFYANYFEEYAHDFDETEPAYIAVNYITLIKNK